MFIFLRGAEQPPGGLFEALLARRAGGTAGRVEFALRSFVQMAQLKRVAYSAPSGFPPAGPASISSMIPLSSEYINVHG